MKYRGTPSSRRQPIPAAAPPTSSAGKAIDLHLHSLFSDGTDRPAEIVQGAQGAGIDIIALADHDSVRGVAEARDACRQLGIVLVPAVELSVGLGDDEIHILGYGVDTKGRPLHRALERLASERVRRMEEMSAALGRLGVAISLEEVRAVAGSEILGRLHLATALVQKGLAGDRNEVFQRWIGAGRPAYVRRTHLDLREAIDIILEAGGVAVMAHPGLTRRDELIEYLVRLGIRGLEVYHPRHSFVDVARYRKMCSRLDLFATGGSDYHGSAKPEVSIGAARTPPEEFEKLLKFIAL